MNRSRVPALLAICLGMLPQYALSDGALSVQSSEARATMKPHASRRLHLPSLRFALVARFDCEAGAAAESVVVSIADTHRRYVPAQGERSIKALLEVPAGQIAPVATGDFCVAEASAVTSELLLPAIATAQVSLRCATDVDSMVRFASAALPLRLVCIGDESQFTSDDASSPDR